LSHSDYWRLQAQEARLAAHKNIATTTKPTAPPFCGGLELNP
jgi:hypothetical protein